MDKLEKLLILSFQAKSFPYIFFDDIYQREKARLSESTEMYLMILVTEPAIEGAWAKLYALIFGKPLVWETLSTEEEVFTTTIHYCAMYVLQYKFEVSEILELVYFMRYKPERYKKELQLWNEFLAWCKSKRDNKKYY